MLVLWCETKSTMAFLQFLPIIFCYPARFVCVRRYFTPFLLL
jgi:hypothetical protein